MAVDWIGLAYKVLAAAGGYCVRVFQTVSGRRRMRRNLYREISQNYQNTVVRIAVVTSLTGLRGAAPMRFLDKLDLSFNVWNFYSDEKRKDQFFELKDAAAINRIYDKFSLIAMDGPGYPHVRGKEAAAEVDDCLLNGSLDRRLYRKVSTPEAWHYMDDLLKGKRKSYRADLNPL